VKAETSLSLAQFVDLLDLYGARLEHWPEVAGRAARSFLGESAEARAALAEAEQLAVMLDAVEVPDPSPYLRARILEVPIRHPREQAVSWWPFRTLFKPALGLAAAALLGILSGAYFPLDGDDVASADWEDMSELALGAHLDLEQW
jgi:hypothetical protein